MTKYWKWLMNKKIFSVVILISFFSCCFSFSCVSVQKKGGVSDMNPDCSGIDYDSSWFYEWEKTVSCAASAERKDFDERLFQRMNFMAGEYHFLRNDIEKGEKFFVAALSGTDEGIIRAVERYLKIDDIVYEKDLKTDNDQNSLFDRYISIIGNIGESAGEDDLDSFYGLYSEVFGTKAPPLLYNIAFIQIYSGQIDQGVELLKTIARDNPELKKIQYDADNKEFAEQKKNIINNISH
jgi:hypothetical protein